MASSTSPAGTVPEETSSVGALAGQHESRGAGGPTTQADVPVGGTVVPAVAALLEQESRGAGGPATRVAAASSGGVAVPTVAALPSPSISSRSPSMSDATVAHAAREAVPPKRPLGAGGASLSSSKRQAHQTSPSALSALPSASSSSVTPTSPASPSVQITPQIGGGRSESGARVSWSGGRIQTSDKAAVLTAFINAKHARGRRLSPDVARRAAELSISVPVGVLLPHGWQRDDGDGHVYPQLVDMTIGSDDEDGETLAELRARVRRPSATGSYQPPDHQTSSVGDRSAVPPSQPAAAAAAAPPVAVDASVVADGEARAHTRQQRAVPHAPFAAAEVRQSLGQSFPADEVLLSHGASRGVAPPCASRPLPEGGIVSLDQIASADVFPSTLTVGDRRARVRDASVEALWSAMSCDVMPCESERPGLHYQGDVRTLLGVFRPTRLIFMMPCEGQCVSLGKMAAVKALDGRMWGGMVAWLFVWCFPSKMALGEQSDVYIRDFYDAPYVVTSPSEWPDGDEPWQKRTLVFYRGCAAPTPPAPGARGIAEWHHARSRDADVVSRDRDETRRGFARGLASVVPVGFDDALDEQPLFAVEVERMALAWHSLGLPLPAWYAAADAQPPSAAERAYVRSRGAGDDRRVKGVVPLLALPREERAKRLAVYPQNVRERLEAATPVAVTDRARRLAAAASRLATAGVPPSSRRVQWPCDDQLVRVREYEVASEPGEPLLHVGSERPHAAPASPLQQRWAPSGSLRQLEPELEEVLRAEPMPCVNVPVATDPEEPPPRFVDPPGPFTTDQLIPADVQRDVPAHAVQVRACIRRAKGSGGGAVHVARRLRPEALIYEEHEALNPCGWGYVWRRRDGEDLWDAVQPSSYPDHPPDSSFKGEVFRDDARLHGMKDEQLVSWGLHGFPGARDMPTGRAVLGFPHAGALKNAEALEATQQRDVENGFVSSGESFPQFWPCVCDPMNIVVQHGKPRATIDKTMRLKSSAHPEPVPSYNDYIDLEAERAELGRPFKLVRVWQFTRGVAILATAGVELRVGKFDLSTYFRMHGKQRLHVWQSGRVLESLFGFDFRVNFGERDAPDHTCRATDGICFFVRVELQRLQRVYPSRCARIMEWLAMRLGLRDDTVAPDRDFLWVVTFFFVYYVDDAALAAFADLLYTESGEPVMIMEFAKDGTISTRQQHRSELYFDAAMQIAQRYGHDTPEKKQSPMDLYLEFLGVSVDLVLARRYLTLEKSGAYRKCLHKVKQAGVTLDCGALAVPRDECNSLMHKLLSASEVIPVGRAHLFYVRKAVKAKNSLDWAAVILGADALRELEWWDYQLLHAGESGLPLASRFSFPTSSDTTVVLYADASRETTDAAASGAGAWAVICGTFVYVEWRWLPLEIRRFSINVLETIVKDVAARLFTAHAREHGLAASHSLAFTDNSTAEHVAERGRATTEALNQLNVRRQAWLVQEGVSQRSERVASVDNDVADMLSRGDEAEALRYPKANGLPVLRLVVSDADRDTSEIAPTWA